MTPETLADVTDDVRDYIRRAYIYTGFQKAKYGYYEKIQDNGGMWGGWWLGWAWVGVGGVGGCGCGCG